MTPRSYFLYLLLLLIVPLSFSIAQETDLTESQKNSVDIIWQGNTYTPPFYRGRALWPNQGEIIFTAVVNNSPVNYKNLNYKWVKNGTVFGNLSGVGRNSYVYSDNGLFLPLRMRVDVLNGEELIGRASIDARPASPNVLVYENSPLIGYVFNKEVNNSFLLNKDEITFTAFPYFFTTESKNNSSIIYSWKTNSSSNGLNNNQVTFRTPESSGKSLIGIDLKSLVKVSQGARKDFLVQFDHDNQI